MAAFETIMGLYDQAPGPVSAAECFNSGSWRHWSRDLEPKLVGAAARAAFKINVTPARLSAEAIAAIADEGYLVEIAARENRVGPLDAVLSNKRVPLAAVAHVRARMRDGKKTPSWATMQQGLVNAAVNHAARYGASATVAEIRALDTVGSYELREVVTSLPASYDDAGFVTELLADDPEVLTGVFMRLHDVSDEVFAALLAGPWAVVARMVIHSRCDDPAVTELLYERCAAETPATLPEYVIQHLCSVVTWLAEHPLGVERLSVLAALFDDGSVSGRHATGRVLAVLAKNPQFPPAELCAATMGGTEWHRALVAGRCLAERFGDDPQAFAVAVGLIESFVGTYGELCDVIAATLAA